VSKRKIFWDEELALEMLKEGKSIAQIGRDLGIKRWILERWFDITGVRPRKKANTKNAKSRYIRSSENKIVEEYASGASISKISQKFGLNPITTTKILRRNDIDTSHWKYSCDEGFFAKDTPESFYFAGVIAADGCVLDGKATLILQMAVKDSDRETLDKLKDRVSFTGPILRHAGNQVRITISSNKVCKDLKRFGIVPRKSLTYGIPEQIKSHSLIRHFIRGLIDGDGWTSKKRNLIGLCGSRNCIDDFIDVASAHCKVKPIAAKPMKSIFYATYRSEEARAVRDWLYAGCEDLCLDRKRDNAYNGWCRTNKERRISIISTDIRNGEEKVYFKISDAKKEGFHHRELVDACNNPDKIYKGYYWRHATKEDLIKRGNITL
jgi:transposase-like protein